MSRDPSRRWASAREFAEALRGVQAELGIAPTPLEIADDEWSAASGAVDFGDTELRGPARSHVERDERRKTRGAVGIAALARDEDTDFSAPIPARRAAAVGRRRHRRCGRRGRRGRRHALRDGRALMRRRTVAGIWAAVVAVGLVIGASVVWPGLDAQETPEVDAAVWALQTGEGRRYARVNTAVGELDTVRSISNPDKVVQAGDAVYLFSDSFSKVTRIDEAQPADLDDQALRASQATPAGTTDVVTAGDFVAYRTDSGAVFAGLLDGGPAAQLDPFPRTTRMPRSTPPTPSPSMIAASCSAIRAPTDRCSATTSAASAVRGRDALDGRRAGIAGDHGGGRHVGGRRHRGRRSVVAGGGCRRRDADNRTVVVGEPDAGGSDVYLADETGWCASRSTARRCESGRGHGPRCSGTPAQPIVHDGEVFAAWLARGRRRVLWSSRRRPTVLDYGGKALGDERRPAFVASDEAVILNETRSGWAWTVPDGNSCRRARTGRSTISIDPDAVPSDEQLAVVIDPKPPIAEPDAFGVRAGSLVSLPVLMNDHDPNEDVLSIDPASVTGLDPGFGTASITDDGQRSRCGSPLVRADGDALVRRHGRHRRRVDCSRAATTVDPQRRARRRESAPQWCGVERCLVPWPTPEVAPGGTVTIPVLPGWVDPEGDPLLLLAVENPQASASVAATPGGEVVYQHSDSGDGGEELVELTVTISDTRGQTVTQAAHRAGVAGAGRSGAVVRRRRHARRGDHRRRRAARDRNQRDDVARVGAGARRRRGDGDDRRRDHGVRLRGASPGTFRVDFTVTDGMTDATGTARITVLPADAPPQLATAPVVAFVHPQEDATLDVFAVVSNPTRRVLLLSDVVAHADDGAVLSVDAVGQNHLRVSGTTASGGPAGSGRSATSISDGTEDRGARVRGRGDGLPPAARARARAHRGGRHRRRARRVAQIDIPVLDNDLVAGRRAADARIPPTVVSSSPTPSRSRRVTCCATSRPSEPGEYAIEYSVFTTGAPVARRHRDGARPGARRRREPAPLPRRWKAAC